LNLHDSYQGKLCSVSPGGKDRVLDTAGMKFGRVWDYPDELIQVPFIETPTIRLIEFLNNTSMRISQVFLHRDDYLAMAVLKLRVL